MKFIPQYEPSFDAQEANALHAYMLSGGYVTEFKKTEEFERALCEFAKVKHCIATTSGTTALSIALLAAGVGPGDEVIVPNYTMIATPNSATMIGAVPVLADIEAQTLNLDLAQVRALITPKTKAVIHVSLNGRCNDLEALKRLCREKNLMLIEDAAQSLGSWQKGSHLGTLADIGIFSFSVPKIISTGQGGALVTNNDDLAHKIRRLKDFGRARGGIDTHDTVGFNFKFTDVQAVIGLEQMKKLPERIGRKKEIYQRYESGLKGLSTVEMIATNLEDTCPWFIDIYVEEPVRLSAVLKSKEIGSRLVYPPIHSQKAYDYSHSVLPVSNRYCQRGLWLPSSFLLSNDDIDRTCDAVRRFFD